MAKILVVEDDPGITTVIAQWLTREQHLVDVVADGREGLELLRSNQYDVVVIDWGLPGLSGIEVLKTYRAERGTAPILMLTAKRELSEKEFGLDSGADDYLTKPFEMKELSARIRALLRRRLVEPSNVLQVGDIVLDPVKHRVTRGGAPIQLMPREFTFLEFLMRHPDAVFAAEALLKRVFPSDPDITEDAVRTYVMRIRQKLDSPGCESIIETIPRVGYRLRAPSS